MLSELVVEGLGVIERVEIALGPGCTALTGETGAGKTLVVAAAGLLLGGRGDRTLVRDGAAEARVEARFVVGSDHPVVSDLGARELLDPGSGEELEVILARTVPADGKPGRARINGHLVTMAALGEAAGQLLEIAGQHEHLQLRSRRVARALLDSFAGGEAALLADTVAREVAEAATIRRRLASLSEREQERERELELVDHDIAEIDAAALQPGELDELVASAARLEHATEIAESVRAAVAALAGETGAEDSVRVALDAARRAARVDPALESLALRLDSLAHELEDVGRELSSARVEPDPAELERVRERIGAISRLMRKHARDEAELLDHLEEARRRRETLLHAAELRDGLESELSASIEAASEAARALSSIRAEAAPRLARAVEEILTDLALPEARFEVALEPASLYEGGTEEVAFDVSTNRGESLKPIGKVASGGELARIALALHRLTASRAGRTMIFDEVDQGVGGAAAHSIGRHLAQLARESSAQVLVVTHLPQVAAFAETHYLVTKEPGGRAVTTVTRLDAKGRIAELSRMLAGLPESEGARQHAQELLDLASGAGV